jgi:hypothetical protein
MTGHFTDAGFKQMMEVYFQGVTAPSNFYVALVNDTIVGTDDWSDISTNEITGTGYAQQTINRDGTSSGWPTGPVLDSSEMQITGKKVTFGPASAADWTSVTAIAIVANLSTDRLIAYANRGSSLSIGLDESYAITPKLKLTKV